MYDSDDLLKILFPKTMILTKLIQNRHPFNLVGCCKHSFIIAFKMNVSDLLQIFFMEPEKRQFI